MKYFIKTYGCQMNKSDSERIAGILETAGYKKASEEYDADLIVLNICSVRQTAIDRIFGKVKQYKKQKKEKVNFKAIATGCILKEDRKRFEKLFDLVIDIKEIRKLKEILNVNDATDVETQQCCVSTTEPKDNYFKINPKYQSKLTAYVPIMTGCNNFCTYCVVPYTRGREYSRPADEILNEITKLVDKGCKEIILLGQNVNSYKGKFKAQSMPCSTTESSKLKATTQNSKPSNQNSGVINFPGLLKIINAIPGNFWIRFLTSHPKDMTEELIKTVARCKKATPYIHLALQSGDDEILKKMNRKYTSKCFLDLIKIIREYIPDAAISTDIIVGFPGETEKQFQNTAKVMKKAKFDMAYISRYSPRQGTAAAKLDDNVSWQEKKRREKILTEILKKTALENNKKYVGKIIDVLIEKIDDNYIYGKTRSLKNVKINIGYPEYSGLDIETNKQYDNMYYHTEDLIGKFIKIKITQADAWGLEGCL
jgi:tRNA-2-methylthio-N6-dimethylallyladenosine synthase